MSAIWVDTDFGFDDLWALLLLKRQGVKIAGISLVAGNASLKQIVANALGVVQAYGLDAPMYSGAAAPLKRKPETAENILGPRGMQSRGRHLPDVADAEIQKDAVDALRTWLAEAPSGARREVLAIGPLTNIAKLVQRAPVAAAKITRLVWMGGSNGPGNHTPLAEFNAVADPEAAAIVAAAGLPLDVVDLILCRKVSFGPSDLPPTDPLTADLLGGYLDIALRRGRDRMSIYDPVAALAALEPEFFEFERCEMHVSVVSDETYGATRFLPSPSGRTRLAVKVRPDAAQICLNALAKDGIHGA
ncbi:nucleoside hydrolase [Hoeflea sp. TYP-13]|uniref:nucleoside hydrolase n=1 Tax=Hoeflea sp. TYP-13 TaxID=3230023 RepID=UPI0034C6C1E6